MRSRPPTTVERIERFFFSLSYVSHCPSKDQCDLLKASAQSWNKVWCFEAAVFSTTVSNTNMSVRHVTKAHSLDNMSLVHPDSFARAHTHVQHLCFMMVLVSIFSEQNATNHQVRLDICENLKISTRHEHCLPSDENFHSSRKSM